MQWIHATEPGPKEISEAIRPKSRVKPITVYMCQDEAAQDEEKIHSEISPTQYPQKGQVESEMHMVNQQGRDTAHLGQQGKMRWLGPDGRHIRLILNQNRYPFKMKIPAPGAERSKFIGRKTIGI